MVWGVLLVLVTWVLALLVIIAIGAPWAMLSQSLSRCGSLSRHRRSWLRPSLWWGLAASIAAVQAVGLVLPLRSAAAGVVILVLAAGSGVVALVIRARTRVVRGAGPGTAEPGTAQPRTAERHRPSGAERLSTAVMLGAAALTVLVFAAAALGPVTNYDSGLYHLGAIAYAGDYATIPGLANLYFPLGYSTSTFPMAAVLGNGPWNGQGFRLLNGFIIVLALADLALRLRRRSLRAVSPGALVLLVGLAVALLPLLWMPDYWVTSPTSDTGVLILTVVCTAALTDAVMRTRAWRSSALTCVVVAALVVTMRPLMSFFAAGVVAVVVVLAIRRRPLRWLIHAIPLGVLVIALAVVQTLRDVRLSGWIQYPLSVLPVDVPWRAADPVLNRTATLGAARDPNDLWNAAQGWRWVGAWVLRLPGQWETPLLAALLLVTAGVLLLVHRAGAGFPMRRVLLILAPAVLTVIVWFAASPPSFRFAWGPIFSLLVVPLGVGLYVLARSPRARWGSLMSWGVTTAAAGIAVLAVVSLLMRVQPLQRPDVIAWSVGGLRVDVPAAQAPQVSTHLLTLDGGLTVLVPADSDQCWATYPLCTPQVDMSVVQLGPGLADGFADSRPASGSSG